MVAIWPAGSMNLFIMFIIKLHELILVIGIYDSIFSRFINSLISPSLQYAFPFPAPWDFSLSSLSLSHISSKQGSDSVQQLFLEYQQGAEHDTRKHGNGTKEQDRAAQSLGIKKTRALSNRNAMISKAAYKHPFQLLDPSCLCQLPTKYSLASFLLKYHKLEMSKWESVILHIFNRYKCSEIRDMGVFWWWFLK